MALRVEPGVTLSPGDIVALNKNGYVVKASNVLVPIGVVVRDPKNVGYVIRRLTKDGYMTVPIEEPLVQTKLDPSKNQDIIDDFLHSMKRDPHLQAAIQSRINVPNSKHVSELREEANREVYDAASNALGIALNDAVDGEMAKVFLGSSKMPTIAFPSLPHRPLPSIPSMPSLTDIDVAATVQDLKIVFDKNGKKLVWVGLLRDDGREVQAPEYDRQSVEIDISGTSLTLKFPMAQCDWGIISHMALYEAPDASMPLLTFPTANSANVTSGSQMHLSGISIQTTPVGLVPSKRLHLPIEDLTVKPTDKESLKGKMEEARLRLKGVFKP